MAWRFSYPRPFLYSYIIYNWSGPLLNVIRQVELRYLWSLIRYVAEGNPLFLRDNNNLSYEGYQTFSNSQKTGARMPIWELKPIQFVDCLRHLANIELI